MTKAIGKNFGALGMTNQQFKNDMLEAGANATLLGQNIEDVAAVQKDLTDKFGFKQVGWRDYKPEKLESWVAWNFYKMGYWVWGSHHHDDENFLGTKPFD